MWAALCCSFDVSAGASLHAFVPIPAPPTGGTMNPAVEIPIPQWWPVGVAAGSCKFTSNVKYNGFTIVLDGHDCGKLIPQITIPPTNSFIPIQMAKSSRKVIFSSAKVRMNSTPAACAAGIALPWPMLSCGDPVSLPGTLVLTNAARTVRVGMTAADVVGGVINAAATIAGDFVADKMGDATDNWVKNNVKSVFAAAGGYVASSVQHTLDPDYPLKTGYTLHLPGGIQFGSEVQWGSSDTTRNPSQVKTKSTIGMGIDVDDDDPDTRIAGVSASAEATYTWDAGENEDAEGWSGKTSKKAGVVGVGEHTDETEYKNGKVTAKNETKGLDGSSSGEQREYDEDGLSEIKNTSQDEPDAVETAGELWDML